VLNQKTLASTVTLEGVGLHTGRPCQITIGPAPENSGVAFKIQSPTGQEKSVSALWQNVCNTVLCTELRGSKGQKVRTVEHLLSAIRGCNLDNVTISCSDNEIPILDGSALPFIHAIRQAGVQVQRAPRRLLKIRKPVRITFEDKWVEYLPHSSCRYDMEIDFKNPAIGNQIMTFDLSYERFVKEIAPARTFGELEQASGLHAAGLALGSSLSNTLIFDKDIVVSHEGKRFDDECVRHKILDAIGDLHLIGGPILGHFRGYKSGHKMHARLLQEVMSSPSTYSWVTAGSADLDDGYPNEDNLTLESTTHASQKSWVIRKPNIEASNAPTIDDDPGLIPT